VQYMIARALRNVLTAFRRAAMHLVSATALQRKEGGIGSGMDVRESALGKPFCRSMLVLLTCCRVWSRYVRVAHANKSRWLGHRFEMSEVSFAAAMDATLCSGSRLIVKHDCRHHIDGMRPF
jgi:hypothetical protein